MTFHPAVIRGDARALPLADDSVDLVISSPPYFALRSYQDGGEHYAGQIGSEATPAEFVDALIEVTRECVRVLKPSGSLWINLGDKYVADNRGSGYDAKRGQAKHAPAGPLGYITGGMRQKSLMGIPWRYAIRCIDDLGLILRAEIIWSKPNGLPESVTDRVRRSHEQWFHFVTQSRYYSAVDEIREATDPRNAAHTARYHEAAKNYGKTNNDRADKGATLFNPNPLGKLPGSVWSIPTEPLKVPVHLGVDHFAAFPLEWPRRIIQGWSPPGVCTACGEGRRPVSVGESVPSRRPSVSAKINHARQDGNQIVGRPTSLITITGYACACPEPTAPTRPAVVLDPFGGTGTTALAARALGRHGISVDMSADYSRLARWRTTDEGELAKALRVDKPAVQVDGQTSIFDLDMASP
jgi:DNA modification methylase